MHGLVFVTWEKYLLERFQESALERYRKAINETPATAPLASRTYDDKLLLAGVEAARRVTGVPTERLLYEYGRYFIMNGLTGHLCAYLLMQVESGHDLLLTMSEAHEQMSRLPDGLTPPLFQYEILSHDSRELVLIYDSPRQLCSLLRGAIEGAAERYGEKASIVERTCMKRGDSLCRFEIRFSGAPSTAAEQSLPQRERYIAQQHFAQFILSVLSDSESDGITLEELQDRLRARGANNKNALRPARLLEALRHLHHAGLVANTANRAGDTLIARRYWRVPATG